MVDTPFVDIQQDIFYRFVVVIRVNAVGSTEATRQIMAEFLQKYGEEFDPLLVVEGDDSIEGGVSGTESRRMYLLGEELYLLGAEKTKSGILDSGVYRVNIRTGRTQRVMEGGAMDFLMEGESLLYRDQRGYIYRIDEVNGENARPERLTQDRASDFVALNDTVYYINVDQEGQLYGTGREEPYNPGGVVKELSVSQGYLIAVFEDGLGGEYKLMILDGEGQAVYQTIEEVLTAAIDKGKIIFLK